MLPAERVRTSSSETLKTHFWVSWLVGLERASFTTTSEVLGSHLEHYHKAIFFWQNHFKNMCRRINRFDDFKWWRWSTESLFFFFTVSSTCWVLHNKTRHHYKWKEIFMKPPTLPFFFTDWQYSLSLCLFKVIASEWEESERSKTVQGKQTVRHFKSLKYLWYGCDRCSTNHFTEVPNGIFFF